MQKTLKYALPLVLICIAVAAAILMTSSRPAIETAPMQLPALLVKVEIAERQPVTFVVKTQGTVTPWTQTTMVAESAGQIVEVSSSFVSGGSFRKGDVLIRIDSRNYSAAVKRAQAQVARATTQAATESAMAGYAAKDWERLRRVKPDASQASALTLRKPQLQQALAELQSAEADLEIAEGDLARTVIRAPYDGLVREKIADVGQYVGSGAQLAKTFAVDTVEVRLPVTQQDLPYLDIAKLRANEPIDVELKANIGGIEFPWKAKITRSEGVFDPSTRVLHLVAQVQDPYDLAGTGRIPLLVGTFVQAEIGGRAGGDLFAVPRHALYPNNVLWLVDENNQLRAREVNVVRTDNRSVYIDTGLEPGDRYCVSPIDQPLPGMKVRYRG